MSATLLTVATAVAVAAVRSGESGARIRQRVPSVASDDLHRVHASRGWGRAGVNATGIYYLSTGHDLFAVDRQTWRVRWRRGLAEGAGITAGVQVVARGDRVLAGDGDLFAVSAETGALLWRRGAAQGDGVEIGRFVGSVSETVAWVGSGSGVMTAIDIATGERRWRQAIGSGRTTVFAPVVSGRLLVAAYSDFDSDPRSGGVAALDPETGHLLWKTPFPRPGGAPASAGGTPAIADDTVVCAASDGTMYGLQREDGSVRWRLSPTAVSPLMDRFEDFSPVVPSASVLLAGSLSGVLRAVEPQAGRVLWRHSSAADGSHGFALEAAGGLVFVPTGSGRLLSVDVGTGRLIHAIGDGTPRFDWPPTVVDGELFLVSEDGLYVGCTDESKRQGFDDVITDRADNRGSGNSADRVRQSVVALGPVCRYLAWQRNR